MADPAEMFDPLSDNERSAAPAPQLTTLDGWDAISPVPDDAPRIIPPHRLGKPSGKWAYRNKIGELLFVVCRFDKGDDDKEVLPLTFCRDAQGNQEWRWRGYPPPRPLYGLDRLSGSPEAPVLIVEGEKTADAAQVLFPDYVAITSAGGSKAADKADWSPLVGRRTVIWPDNDDPGTLYADDVRGLASLAEAASVAIVSVPQDFSVGWDLADEPSKSWDVKRLAGLLMKAKPNRDNEVDLSVLKQFRRTPPMIPLDAFGPFWSDWLSAAAKGSGSPVDYPAAALLASISSLLGNARWVTAWQGWHEPTPLWIGLVGNPGDGKSPGVDPVFDLLRTLETEIAGDFDSVIRQYEADKEAAKVERDLWQDEVKNAVKDGLPPPVMPEGAMEPDDPIRPRLRISDVTPEALGKLLAGHPKGLLFWRDELSGWLGSFDRYGGSGGERAMWLESYGGRPFVIDRIKLGEPIRIPHLTVSVLGTIQPDKLVSALLKGDDDGLPGRFAWVWPEPLPPSRPTVTPDNIQALNALRRICQLEMVMDDQGVLHPAMIPLGSDGADMFHNWRLEHYGDANTTGGLIASANAKMAGRVLRVAIALEFLWWSANPNAPEPKEISKAALAYSAGLAEDYFKPMSERVYGDASLPEQDRKAATLARWIKRERPEVINVRDLCRKIRLTGLTTTKDAEAALKSLAEANWVFPPKREHKRGQPKKDWRVNSRLWEVLK